MEVAAWREREAQARDLPRQRVLKDDALAEIAQQQPKSAEELGRLRALPKGYERSRAGEAIVAAVAAGLERDPKSVPKITREKPLSNGASATVELLKVLLRMTSERHGVAAKVIATVDDLEQIASDENADVPALKGWRREMFGNEALKLKRGGMALAVEAGRVIAIDRGTSS
jgi:ribonuclease D